MPRADVSPADADSLNDLFAPEEAQTASRRTADVDPSALSDEAIQAIVDASGALDAAVATVEGMQGEDLGDLLSDAVQSINVALDGVDESGAVLLPAGPGDPMPLSGDDDAVVQDALDGLGPEDRGPDGTEDPLEAEVVTPGSDDRQDPDGNGFDDGTDLDPTLAAGWDALLPEDGTTAADDNPFDPDPIPEQRAPYQAAPSFDPAEMNALFGITARKAAAALDTDGYPEEMGEPGDTVADRGYDAAQPRALTRNNLTRRPTAVCKAAGVDSDDPGDVRGCPREVDEGEAYSHAGASFDPAEMNALFGITASAVEAEASGTVGSALAGKIVALVGSPPQGVSKSGAAGLLKTRYRARDVSPLFTDKTQAVVYDDAQTEVAKKAKAAGLIAVPFTALDWGPGA